MGGMTTFGNNDSVFSHGEDSISMLNRLAEIAKEAFKYIPEEDCTVACGTFVDIDKHAFISAVQHFRESIEAYRDLCDELEDDKDEIRHEYEEKVIQFFNRFMNADLTDETNYRAGELARLVHQLDNRVGELDQELEQERERSNQLEEKVRSLTTKFKLAKKFLYQRREEVSRLKEELRQTQIVKDAQKKVIDEKEKQICDLYHEIWELQVKAEFWEDSAKKGYIDTDIAHMYPKTTINNAANFCGNCKHFVTHPCDIATCNNKYASPIIVDPDDASCSHFESNQADRSKPDQPCCEACNRDDCDDCALCPF